MNKRKPRMLLMAIVVAFTTGSAHAVPSSVSFDDSVGDFFNFPIDLVGMTLVFDNATGAYEFTVAFDAANPFFGTFNVNMNLLNGSISPLTTNPAFVIINERPILSAPTTQLVFTGINPRLTSWNHGDLIANSSSIFGIPIDAAFSAFSSGISDFGQGIDELTPAASAVAPVTGVTEPSSFLLLGIGLLGLGFRHRRA